MAETLEGWKEQALAAMEEHAALEEKCTDLELAHAELVESSTAAEEELEERLQESEQQAKKALRAADDLKRANEKLEGLKREYSKQADRLQAELDSIRSADAANKDQRIRREEQSEKDENELRILKASVEGLEGQNENLLEENAMLKMDLDELQESSTETDFCLRQELRDAQSELERLQRSGPAAGADGSAAAKSDVKDLDSQTVDAVLQRVQALQRHLANCRSSVQTILVETQAA